MFPEPGAGDAASLDPCPQAATIAPSAIAIAGVWLGLRYPKIVSIQNGLDREVIERLEASRTPPFNRATYVGCIDDLRRTVARELSGRRSYASRVLGGVTFGRGATPALNRRSWLSFSGRQGGPRTGMGIQVDVTNEAQSQVRELIRSQKPGTGVRVYLEAAGGGCGCGAGGGGCGCGGGHGGGGLRFGMAFDERRPGDQVIPVDSFSLLVDGESAGLLDGARIDFVQTLDATGFKIDAPKLAVGDHGPPGADASPGCGCGEAGCGHE